MSASAMMENSAPGFIGNQAIDHGGCGRTGFGLPEIWRVQR